MIASLGSAPKVLSAMTRIRPDLQIDMLGKRKTPNFCLKGQIISKVHPYFSLFCILLRFLCTFFVSTITAFELAP